MGVFSELKPKNNARKNPFDLSCYSTYNTKVGYILPLQSWPTLPSSEYELDLKALMRTQPLQTAAFAGFSINYDVIWSPYNDHYSSFNQFIAQRLNKQHVTQPDIEEIPNFPLNKFVWVVIMLGIYETLASEVDNFDNYVNDYIHRVAAHPFIVRSRHFKDNSFALGIIRNLDLLGYGNYLPLLKTCVNLIKTFLDSPETQYGYNHDGTISPGSSSFDRGLPHFFRYLALCNGNFFTDADGNVKIETICYLTGECPQRIWYMSPDNYLTRSIALFEGDGLFFELYNVRLHQVFQPTNERYSLWDVMLYNKAFWQFYRNEYYDEEYVVIKSTNTAGLSSSSVPYVELFNFDDYQTFDIDNTLLEPMTLRLLCMFAVKPHQYKKDLFTGLLPSTQYGSVSVASTDDIYYKLIGNNPTVDASVNLKQGQVYSVNYNNPYGVLREMSSDQSSVSVRSNAFRFDPQPMISVLELRKADALQRFKERMLRAGNRTKDIFKAHGWDEPFSEKAFEVEFLGTFDGRLDINVVASTAGTDSHDLGQLAANGIGVIGGSKIHFKCHDFGCLQVVAYITKDAVYDAFGVDKRHSLLESFDFPYPELQNVSLSPITNDELNHLDPHFDVLGYLPQNMCYKTAVDKVHGEFFAVNPFTNAGNAPDDKVIDPMGIFSDMVTPRLDIEDPKSLMFYYIQSDCADNIFVVNASPSQDTDQFYANVHFDLKAVQPLDVIGLPI